MCSMLVHYLYVMCPGVAVTAENYIKGNIIIRTHASKHSQTLSHHTFSLQNMTAATTTIVLTAAMVYPVKTGCIDVACS